MITFKTLTVRNFLSVGAVTQTVNLDTNDLTLVLGENLDLGGGGSRNGVGKSTILQALHYVLFNISINNNIRKDNLVNLTNSKNMLVTLSFNVDGVDYEIRRGRKPGVLQFYVNNTQREITDAAQGESRETQREIERILNLSPELFTQLTLLSTYTTPFLALKSNEQRTIIESLLGISQLSERAELIKERMRATKDEITQEEYRIKATTEANRRIAEQIESLQRRQALWAKKRDADLSALITEYDELSKIDIDAELAAHVRLGEWGTRKTEWDRYNALLARHNTWLQRRDTEALAYAVRIDELSSIDIEAELAAHQQLALHKEQQRLKIEYDHKIDALRKELAKEHKNSSKLDGEIKTLREHKCYACGQEFHDEQHTAVLEAKTRSLSECESTLNSLRHELDTMLANPVNVVEKPNTHYSTEAQAFKHNNELSAVVESHTKKCAEISPFAEQLDELCSAADPGAAPRTHYDTESAAFKHSSRVASLLEQIALKNSEVDPYSEQIADMTSTAIVEVSFDHMNALQRHYDHQRFLHDLLTNKDSFVRKRIIDQNLGYLNGRLQYYLDRLRLAHTVCFKNNLEVDISEFGRELDWMNLSRGEQNRVIFALSFAFRDLYENLFHRINSVLIDEIIDNGLDTNGVESSVALLKEQSRNGRSVFLISHREELIGRVGTVLKVTKENGFTNYEIE